MSYILELIEKREGEPYWDSRCIEYNTHQEALEAGLRARRNYKKAGREIDFEVYHS